MPSLLTIFIGLETAPEQMLAILIQYKRDILVLDTQVFPMLVDEYIGYFVSQLQKSFLFTL
jgi:hypothetical protein